MDILVKNTSIGGGVHLQEDTTGVTERIGLFTLAPLKIIPLTTKLL